MVYFKKKLPGKITYSTKNAHSRPGSASSRKLGAFATANTNMRISSQDALHNRITGFIGDHLLRLEKSKRGLFYYNEALAQDPYNTTLLCKRAEAYSRRFLTKKAMADIDIVSKHNPDDVKVANHIQNFLYLDGEFEKSLLLSLKNLKIRRQPPHFSLAVLKAKNSVNDCVGDRAGHPLRDHYEVIRELAWQKNMSMQKGHPKRRKDRYKRPSSTTLVRRPSSYIITASKPLKPVKPYITSPKQLRGISQDCAIAIEDPYYKEKRTIFSNKKTRIQVEDEPVHKVNSQLDDIHMESQQSLQNQSIDSSLADAPEVTYSQPLVIPKVLRYPYHPLQRRTENIMNLLACCYLGELFHDRQFLENLPKRPGCEGLSGITNQIIHHHSKDGLHLLDRMQEILRTKRPFYHIKYQEYLCRSKKVEMDKLKLLERKKIHVINKLNWFFSDLVKEVKMMDLGQMFKTAEQLYKFCKSTQKCILPNKEEVLCRLYKLVGDGFLFSNRFVPGATKDQNLIKMYLVLGLPSLGTSLEELEEYRKLKGTELNWQHLINTYNQRVKICKYTEELIWLYHELARFNIEKKRYQLAKTYAGKCIHESRKCENFRWTINAYMLITKISVIQKNKSDATRHLRLIMSTVNNIKNKELDYFFQKCFRVVYNWQFETDEVEELLNERQQNIIEVLPLTDQQRTAMLLFEKINQRPPDRRLPVIPGLIDTEKYDELERIKEDRRMPKRTPSDTRRGMEAEEIIQDYMVSPNYKY